MLKRYLSIVLIALLVGGINLKVSLAQTNPDEVKEKNRIEKLRAEISRLGVGKQAKVVVKLKNGAKLQGYITQAIEDSFDLTDPISRGFTTIPYGDVAEIEKEGSLKSSPISSRTILTIGIIAGLIVLSKMKRKRGTSPRCPLFGC
jgi:hypothetical protein